MSLLSSLEKSWIIARREIASYFVSPIGYVAIAGFSVLSGWIFFNLLARYIQLTTFYLQMIFQNPDIVSRFNAQEMIIQPTYLNMTILLIILFPLLTMRVIAEERRQHTDELLFTSPVTSTSVVFGKFLAVLVVYLLMLLPTLLYPVLLFKYAQPAPSPGEFASIYIGLLLLGMAFASVGIFTSSITTNQIVAAVSCFAVLLLIYVIDWISTSSSGTVREVLEYISLIRRYQDFVKGMVDLRSVVYFLSLVVLGLFLARSTLEALRLKS
jgi:ABC-2 type transport system permease protein